MIHANRIVTVGDQESIIDRPIVLYRGDREVEIEFTLVGNEFTFSEEGNVIKSVNASHGQLVLNTPSGEHMFSELAECHEGKVVFVVTKEMIDEFIEMGFYSFQIRLYDSAEMKSRVTIPPVLSGFDIRNPIAAEDETNVVDQGIVDYARIFKDQSNEELPTFTWDGEYVKTEWAHHDVITENKMNKIEDALYSINANIKESDVVMLNALDNVKKDSDAYVKEHMAEVEADVEEFERNLNTDVQQFKIDTNAAMTAHKNEVGEVANRIPHVNIKDFGAKGDGVTDDTEAIKKAIATGHNVLIPEGQFLVTDTLSLNTSLELFGANRAKSILKTPYEFGANKPLLKIDSQKVHIHGFSIEGNIGNPENITHDKKYPDSCGIAIHIPSTSDRQWSRIENLFISGMDIGLSYNSTYYHNAIRVEINNCNKAIVFTNKPVGSINIYDSHIRDNRIAGIYSEGCNNVNITNCIFEWNKYHIYTNSSMGDGGISFTGCYLSDGPYKAIYMNGGKVNIDSCNTNYIAGTGGRMSETYPNGYYPDQEVKDAKTEYITCNIDVKGGELYVKNTVLGRGSWGNVGYTFGTYDNGNSIEIKGSSKVVFDNVLFSEGGFLHSESNDDSLYYSDKIENYIVNGNLYSINNIPNSFSGITSSNLTYETKKSPYGGNSIKIDVTDTSYIKFKFKVPEKLVGEVLLLGMVVGNGSNLINTTLFPENQSFSYVVTDKYYYPSKAMSGSNRLINFSPFKDMTEWMYAPITVNNVSGEINFKIQKYDTNKPAFLNIHSVFLIERRNFRKIGLLEDVNTI